MAQDIRDKIAKLLALADSPSEAEARAALLKARELMAKHKLRPEEIKKAENVKVIKETIGVSCTGMTDPWMANLAAVIAGHYCCCSYRQTFKGKKTKHIGLVGLEDDFAICKTVVLYAIDCIQSAKKEIAAENKGLQKSDIRKMCNAYGWGFVYGLQQAFKEQDQEHQEWGLVLVVPKQVTDVMIGMGSPPPSATPTSPPTGRSTTGAGGMRTARSSIPNQGWRAPGRLRRSWGDCCGEVHPAGAYDRGSDHG